MNPPLTLITSQTPDGDFRLILDEKDVALAAGFSDKTDLIKRLPAEYKNRKIKERSKHPYQKLIQAYYTGDKKALSKLPYRLHGTVFQKQLWQALAKVPYGKTLSYKELAEKAGVPKAVRATGGACGANRLILLIPCHRILKSDGRLGSYLYGSKIKKSLLDTEARHKTKKS